MKGRSTQWFTNCSQDNSSPNPWWLFLAFSCSRVPPLLDMEPSWCHPRGLDLSFSLVHLNLTFQYSRNSLKPIALWEVYTLYLVCLEIRVFLYSCSHLVQWRVPAAYTYSTWNHQSQNLTFKMSLLSNITGYTGIREKSFLCLYFDLISPFLLFDSASQETTFPDYSNSWLLGKFSQWEALMKDWWAGWGKKLGLPTGMMSLTAPLALQWHRLTLDSIHYGGVPGGQLQH